MATTYVTASFNYYVPSPDGAKPFIRVETGEKNFSSEKRSLQVENLREHPEKASLDTTGFQYVKRGTKLTNFNDDKAIEEVYYPESIQLIKEVTGASRVVLFDHTIRKRQEGAADGPGNRQPAAAVHVDQSSGAAYNRVKRHLPAEDAEKLLKGRFQIVNLWRPLNHSALDHPLALCDYRSIDPKSDLIPTNRIYGQYTGETLNVKYNPEHKWKYVRGLEPDEAVLIKCFDSIQDGSVAVLTPHTAFVDPTAPADAPPRESIEIRSLVFYE